MTRQDDPAIRPEPAETPAETGLLRLAKLRVQGFKSFADLTEFTFDDAITCVVGPNGCGKSNVVDAVKWVLGEQSAKSLRGAAMMDVIFNGSADRKPAGSAEVTLVFTNPEAEGGRPLHLDLPEVSVTRLLYRDGTSKYRINGKNARLKDIRDLFLDTGVGVDAYSVIEQGRVAQMLDANPAQRRLIFEEAAGISRYKARKKEALQKLNHTQTNLSRLRDILDEVDRRLRSVKLQAGKARNYQELAARLADLRLRHALNSYRGHVEKLAELGEKDKVATERHAQITKDRAAAETQLVHFRQRIAETAEAKQSAERDAVQHDAEIQRAKQSAQYAQRRREEIDRQAATLADDRAAAEAKRQKITEELAETTARLGALAADVEKHAADIAGREEAYRNAQHRQNERNAAIERDKAAVIDLLGKLGRLGSRLDGIGIERKNVAAQQQKLGERRREVVADLEQADAAVAEVAGQLEDVAKAHEQQQADAETVQQTARDLGGRIASFADELAEIRERRSGLQSRRKVLEDLEKHQEGLGGAVKKVLAGRKTKYPFIRGIVADVLRVDVEHAEVIEAALTGRDQWLVAADSAAALEQADTLNELSGRVQIVRPEPMDDQPPVWPAAAKVRRAIDLIRVEPADRPIAAVLLGKTAVVGSLDDAATLHVNGPAGWRYVTRRGEVLEADGTLHAGQPGAAVGLLSRRSQMDDLARQVADADAEVEKLNEKLAAGNEQAQDLEKQLNALRQSIYETNAKRVELDGARRRASDHVAGLRREQPVLEAELAKLLEQSTKLKVEEQQISGEKRQAEEKQAEHQANVERHQQAVTEAAQRVRELAEALTSARVAAGQVREQHVAAREQARREQAAADELQQQIARFDRVATEADDRRRSAEKDAEQAADAGEVATAKRAEVAKKLEELATTLAEHEKQSAEQSRAADAARQRQTDVEAQLRDIELKTSDRKVRLETLVTRSAEEDEIDLPTEHAKQPEPSAEDALTDWAAVASEIKELRGRIARLGNVNLDAIADQEELEKRHADLTQQATDVEDAAKQLAELIDHLNVESGKRFEVTFEAVREHFQAMFRKLFGGGRADLYLETELADRDGQTQKIDPLDAGIEIIARPPGKQPTGISQLSGGEKTMTCIALLLSIFQSKPSPFCILDEVDAALDEANNVRFNKIIEDFLGRSQFIVITHSKRTMQIADVLYGVTMQQQGVSKKVAVRLDAA
jgi:chromosome segregation protein